MLNEIIKIISRQQKNDGSGIHLSKKRLIRAFKQFGVSACFESTRAHGQILLIIKINDVLFALRLRP